MPVGYLIGVALIGGATALTALAPRRPRWLGALAFRTSVLVNEATAWVALALIASSALMVAEGDATTASGRVGLVAAALVLAVHGYLIVQGARTGAVLRAALDPVVGPDDARAQQPSGPGAVRSALLPLPFLPRQVERLRGLHYGPEPEQRLDLFRLRGNAPGSAPVFVHLHGGGFRSGQRGKEALALLHDLARRGWVCVTADYHLSRTPGSGHPRHLVDIKRLLAWLGTDGAAHGTDPRRVVVAGTSAGAHLATMAALTADRPEYQPGFEEVDTSIRAAVGFAGYYGPVGGDTGRPTSPADFVRADAPPMLLLHGDKDTEAPAQWAAAFADAAAAASENPVVHVELPAAHHSFDLLASLRFWHVRRGVRRFAEWAVGGAV